MNNRLEAITKAAQTADLLAGDLREALIGAPPLQEIIITPLLEDSINLSQRINKLHQSLNNE